MLGKLFSGGAADLIKNVGGVIDNLHTSEEGRARLGISDQPFDEDGTQLTLESEAIHHVINDHIDDKMEELS